MTAAGEVLKFWFEECEPAQWFKKDEAFDTALKTRFGKNVERALSGGLQDWSDTRDDTLALILLLDQFTRNIHRDTPKAFAGDVRALALSWRCIAQGWLEGWNTDRRTFALMPMMHSEVIAVQEASLPLFKRYTTDNSYDYAVRHRDIVDRFARFPHRNAILGRESTEAESAFLKQDGSSF